MEKTDRRRNETDLEYHKRLVYGKLVDGTLSDMDYSELAPFVYGKDYSSDVARRMMYGSRRTLDLIGAEAERGVCPDDIISELDAKKIEVQKERQRFYDQRNALNKMVRERARQEELNDIIRHAILNGNLPQLECGAIYEHNDSDNDILVSLNDIHYGACVDNYWNKYNSDICKTMLQQYLDRIVDIASLHGSENCIVWANGDLISGNIHHSVSVTNKENVIEQLIGVSELISEFLAALSRYFVTVRFVSVAGNHSRIDTKDRALKDERLDDLVEWYIRARLQNFENIIFGDCEKIDSTIYLMDIRGKKYCGVHGDYDFSPAKIQSLQAMAQCQLYAVLSGHLHHCKIDDVQGVKTIMAGSFLGMDDYCVAKRIYGNPEQMVCICDNTGIRCSYNVNLKQSRERR